MTPTETTNILRQFNEWQRGDGPLDYVPSGLINAIDAAVEMIESAEEERALCDKLADILTRTANVLKGEIDAGRDCANKPPFKGLIVESDWPEYEPTWKAIEARVTGAQPAQKAVAYLDLGVGGYMDIGTDLTDEQLSSLPKGRHMLGIVGTYGVDGYVSAQPAPSLPDGWKEAAISWEVCASIHREYARGKDPFFSTRQGDFVKHAQDARNMFASAHKEE